MPPAVRLSPLADSDKHLMPDIEVDDYLWEHGGNGGQSARGTAVRAVSGERIWRVGRSV